VQLARCVFTFQIQRDTGLWYSVEYSSFSVGAETDKYRLSVSGFSGDAGDAMVEVMPKRIADGMQFSTVDQDNDLSATRQCSKTFSAWWLQKCTRSALNLNENGVWNADSNDIAIRDVVFARMLVKLD